MWKNDGKTTGRNVLIAALVHRIFSGTISTLRPIGIMELIELTLVVLVV